MAELATIARPYAEALFQVAQGGDMEAVAQQVRELALIADDPQLREFSDHPKVNTAQVMEVVLGVVKTPMGETATNLLRVLLENGRLAVLPEIASQFVSLKNSRAGVLDAMIESPFPMTDEAIAELNKSLERRFGRRLRPALKLVPDLIGGVRVVVGDEVLDTSVRARLEQMKAALTA